MSKPDTSTSPHAPDPEAENVRSPRLRARRVMVVASPSLDVATVEPALRELATRGHHLELAVAAAKAAPADTERLASELPRLRIAAMRARRDHWAPLAEGLRSPRALARLRELPLLRSRPGTAALEVAVAWAERAIPTAASIDEEIAGRGLDLVVATADAQPDFVRSARQAGMRTALLATEWSDFTGADPGDVPVDRAFVWNDEQRKAAIARLGLASERVIAVGASGYDPWFARRAAVDRTAFLTALGLPAERPAILYAVPAGKPEPKRIAKWVDALRGSPHARLRDASVLVRPHPASSRADLKGLAGFVLVSGDAIPHADCVVCADPPAAIESAIAARPALAAPGDAVAATLLREHGGPLLRSRTLEEHLDQLAAALDGGGPAPSEAFLRALVRPGGLERPAAAVLADAIEDLLAGPWPEPVRPSPAQLAARPLLWLAACSPQLPRVKGIRRSRAAERIAGQLASRQHRRLKRAGKG